MVELTLPIKKGSEVQVARERLLSVTASQYMIHESPAPTVVVSAVTDTSVVLLLHAWADSLRYRQASYELAERAAETLADM
jgi:small-conductance mechanosensitive channel